MNYSEIVSFIRKTFSEPENMIILHDPRFCGNERKYLLDAMDSNFVSSVGEYVGKFEKEIADYTGARYAVAAVNGTSALHISLLPAGVHPDEEVITQPVSFIATCRSATATDIVLVHGDTTTSTAAALAAFFKQIPVGHVEAGLRTNNIYSPMTCGLN